MPFKGWFKGGSTPEPAKSASDELTIEDLIVLERYGEAEERLKAVLKAEPDDLHAHLKLAEVYSELRRPSDATDQYIYVAEEYAQDGFYDKGIALLARAMKLTPGEEALRAKLFTLERAKALEHKLAAAVEGLRQSRVPGGGSGTAVLQLQRAWHHLAVSPLVQRLSAEHLRRLFASVEMVSAAAGRHLVMRGSGEAALWIPLTATIEAFLVRGDGRETLLRTFAPGAVIGEGSLFEKAAWPADYRVIEEGWLLKLDRGGLEHGLLGNSDPRGFLEALRVDGYDREIASAVAKLEGIGR